MSYSHFIFLLKSTPMNCCLKKFKKLVLGNDSCLPPNVLFNFPCNPNDLNLWELSLLLPPLQLVRAINNATQKFTLEYYIEHDNHYIYNNHLFKPILFCESVLVVKFAAYD